MTRSPTPLRRSLREPRLREEGVARSRGEERGKPAGASFYRDATRRAGNSKLTFICDISRAKASEGKAIRLSIREEDRDRSLRASA